MPEASAPRPPRPARGFAARAVTDRLPCGARPGVPARGPHRTAGAGPPGRLRTGCAHGPGEPLGPEAGGAGAGVRQRRAQLLEGEGESLLPPDVVLLCGVGADGVAEGGRGLVGGRPPG